MIADAEGRDGGLAMAVNPVNGENQGFVAQGDREGAVILGNIRELDFAIGNWLYLRGPFRPGPLPMVGAVRRGRR